MPPRNARDILDRLNEIGFNASVVLEINAIEAVNRVLADLDAANTAQPTKYRPVRFHLIRDDHFLAEFGLVSKSSTSWSLIDTLFKGGRAVADRWLTASHALLGRTSSCNVRAELVKPVLGATGVAPTPAPAGAT
jgi:NTE family protein